MSEEDRKLLKAVRDYRPPEKLHPMAMACWHIYHGRENKLGDEGIAECKQLFDAYVDAGDFEGLAAAMEGGVRFMLLIGDHMGDKENAKAFGDLLRGYMHHFEAFWQRVAEAMENEGAGAANMLGAFLDEDDAAKKTAPKYGEKAPEGTLQVKNLMQPARPPPWAKKK